MVAALLALSCQRNLGPPFPDGGGGARSSGGGNGGSPTASAGGRRLDDDRRRRQRRLDDHRRRRQRRLEDHRRRRQRRLGRHRRRRGPRGPAARCGQGHRSRRSGAGLSGRLHASPARAPRRHRQVRAGQMPVFRRRVRARVRQLQRQRQHRLRNRHVDRQQLRKLLLQVFRAADLSSPHQRRLSVRESVQRSVSRRVRLSCVDLKIDLDNCGSCGNQCYIPNALLACQAGKCVSQGCSDPSYADCTSDPGCETILGTTADCGSCGDPRCTAANTLFTCSDGGDCKGAVCAPGFANCDTTSPDCETALDSPPAGGGGCLPQYVGTVPVATQLFDNAVTAIAGRRISSWPARSRVRSISIHRRTATSA